MARAAQALLLCAACCWLAEAQPSIDGGRSELPGMKQDVFDQIGRNKKPGPARTGKGPPECPKSDGMSAFPGLAFVGADLFVKLNSSEDTCQRLISVGGANATVLKNASRTCGPAGEWKKRIAENMSSVFFQGGLDWVKSENETIVVVTENGTFEVEVTENKYEEMLECWKYGCQCEQAKNPVGKAVLVSLLAIALTGLGYDSLKLMWQKLKGEKPSKHVTCKNGHRLEEVSGKNLRNHYCDMCAVQGVNYQCAKCNYDLCKKCYKEAKKKAKAAYKEWLDKHPEEKEKEAKKDDKDEQEEKEEEEKSKAESSDAADDKKVDDGDTSAAESTAGKSTAAEGEAEDEEGAATEEAGAGDESKAD